ncbi:MAG: FtsW/RodA/SpoVE family cell cycle protein [Phycisphaerales bacterium]|jgi:cell division protein FtsW
MLRARHGIVLAVLGLLVVATVMVNSASLNLSRGGETTLDSVFWGKHTWFALGAAMALLVGAMVPVDRLGRTGATWWTTPVFWVAVAVVVGMALVQVPGIGREANGARRWISLGPIGLQPSEIAKWGVPIMVAWYAIRERARLHTFTWGFAVPLAAVSAVCGLIALEDLGTAVLIELVTVAMLVVAGARGIWVAAMAPVGLLAFVVLVITSPYRVNRIIAFLDPYADARGIGYHIIQSLEAIAGGGVAGRGLGNSELKFGYLPEATTDFIYSIVAEELGIAGSAVVVGLYVLFILCGLAVIGATARGAGSAPPVQSEGGSGSVATATAPATVEPELLSNFARLLGFGILLTVGVQALINICVVTGLAPTKGIALPLMSRGGTGWILTCLSIGLLISMDRGADRRRRELGLPVPGEEQDPFLQPVVHGTAAGTAAGAA